MLLYISKCESVFLAHKLNCGLSKGISEMWNCGILIINLSHCQYFLHNKFVCCFQGLTEFAVDAHQLQAAEIQQEVLLPVKKKQLLQVKTVRAINVSWNLTLILPLQLAVTNIMLWPQTIMTYTLTLIFCPNWNLRGISADDSGLSITLC